ncbi:MAG TPA: nucleoside monophosphate kinase [Verrucomicrobiae bacterium]|nr:nucleoside monophosphate kinase [Verrucomicrobiae bacterium]
MVRFDKCYPAINVSVKQKIVRVKLNYSIIFYGDAKGGSIILKAIIFGAPGAGKGTYASRLQARLGVEVIATGDIFRELMKEDSELGRKVKSFVEKGLLVPDEVVVEVLKLRLSKIPKQKGFILDGYPRTLEQAKILESITEIDVILLLNVPDWIIIERLSSRRICRNCGNVYNIRFLKPKVEGVCDKCGGHLYQRPDDTPEVIKKRLQVYQEQTKPLLEYFKEKKVPFVTSSATSLDQPPEPIVDKMVAELKKLKIS